jgi:hypothetical protein
MPFGGHKPATKGRFVLRETKIVVVDGADGLTPDMLRKPCWVPFITISREEAEDFYGKRPLQEFEPVERIRGQFE